MYCHMGEYISLDLFYIGLHLFNTKLSPKSYWQGPRSQEVGEEGDFT